MSRAGAGALGGVGASWVEALGCGLGLCRARTKVQASLLHQQLIYQVQGLLSLPPFLPPPFLNLQLIHPEGRGELIMVITAAHGPECWRWMVAERCATGELGAACWDLLSTTTTP